MCAYPTKYFQTHYQKHIFNIWPKRRLIKDKNTFCLSDKVILAQKSELVQTF